MVKANTCRFVINPRLVALSNAADSLFKIAVLQRFNGAFVSYEALLAIGTFATATTDRGFFRNDVGVDDLGFGSTFRAEHWTVPPCNDSTSQSVMLECKRKAECRQPPKTLASDGKQGVSDG